MEFEHKKKYTAFVHLLSVNVKGPLNFQLESRDLQADSFLMSDQEKERTI